MRSAKVRSVGERDASDYNGYVCADNNLFTLNIFGSPISRLNANLF